MSMKLIIKETKKLKEQNNTSEVEVEMLSSDFLKLTTDEELMDYLRKRSEISPMDYNPIKADKLLLLVDKNGKVISHEGRNRSYANIQKNGKTATQKVILRTQQGDINNIKTLYGQFDQNAVVDATSLKKITDKLDDENVGDILEIGDQPIQFETEIIPAGFKFPNGRVNPTDYKRKDGEKEARFLLNQVYTKMYKVLRKTRGWGPDDHYHHNDVADATDKVLEDNYMVNDEKGILKPKMSRGSYYHLAFDRPTVGTITIKKK